MFRFWCLRFTAFVAMGPGIEDNDDGDDDDYDDDDNDDDTIRRLLPEVRLLRAER